MFHMWSMEFKLLLFIVFTFCNCGGCALVCGNLLGMFFVLERGNSTCLGSEVTWVVGSWAQHWVKSNNSMKARAMQVRWHYFDSDIGWLTQALLCWLSLVHLLLCWRSFVEMWVGSRCHLLFGSRSDFSSNSILTFSVKSISYLPSSAQDKWEENRKLQRSSVGN